MKGFSTYASNVDATFLGIVGIAAAVLLGITLFMIYCLLRYNRKRNPKAADIQGNLFLETTWTIVPTIIFMGMFYYGWRDFGIMRTPPKGAMEVKVNARMWSWYFEYSNGKGSNTLKVPVGKPVKLLLHSQDVIHSFYVPAFRIKEDTVPDKQNYLWFNPKEEGTYDVLCAEYCGELHSYMRTTVEVMASAEFQKWFDTPPPLENIGEDLIKGKGGCTICHSLDGSPKLAPTFKGIWGRTTTVITAGNERTITIDEEYLKKAILDPQADIVKGFEKITMPPQRGILNDKEIQAMVEFLKKWK
jgi:cytochrome c oxidase subunit 2